MTFRKLGYKETEKMDMTTRYEAYNEMTFEAYCKTAISRSVLKERLRKAEQGKREQPLSIVTNAMLYVLSCEDTGIEQTEAACRTFYVRGVAVPVHGEKLGQVLSYLMPRDREIVLSYFFLGLTVKKIAQQLRISQATVTRRRKAAVAKLRDLLGSIP